MDGVLGAGNSLAIVITAFDVTLLLSLQGMGVRMTEALVGVFVLTIGVCYGIEIFVLPQTQPVLAEMAQHIGSTLLLLHVASHSVRRPGISNACAAVLDCQRDLRRTPARRAARGFLQARQLQRRIRVSWKHFRIWGVSSGVADRLVAAASELTHTTMKTTIATLGALAVAAAAAFAQDKVSESPAGPGKHASLEEVFKKLDANGDGFLSLDEFKASPLGKRDAAKAEEIFKSMDTNSDGKVTLEEFKAFRPTLSPERIFNRLDTNGDGVLSLDEFKASQWGRQNPAKAEAIFKKMDANSDGRVTLEEFKAFRPQRGKRGGNDTTP